MTKGDSPPPAYPSISPPQPSQTDYITWYLSHLAPQIRLSRQRDQSHRDATILSLLTPHITAFLDAFATRSREESAEVVLVPAAASAGWTFVRPAGGRGSEVGGLVEVAVDKESAEKLRLRDQNDHGRDGEPQKAVTAEGSGEWQRNEFDDWGRWDSDPETAPDTPEYLWWSDEALAKRLARLLQPNQPRPVPPPQAPREPARPAASKWDILRSPDPLEPKRPARGYGPSMGAGRGGVMNMGVGMSVKAEEVTFRRENEMGIWESRGGFALVVRVWGG